jgi:acyl CoA:acetate/3-ketoacid CoA transferase beta subunit
MKVIERAEGVSVDEIRSKTEASLTIAEQARAA